MGNGDPKVKLLAVRLKSPGGLRHSVVTTLSNILLYI